MRANLIKITYVATLAFLCGHVNALETSSEERTCAEIGFKRKTEAFGNCVLDLLERGKSSSIASNDPDDATCKKYGFRSGTSDYAKCRQQIDMAKQQANQDRIRFEEEQRRYQAQLDEQKKQRERAAGMAMLGMGLGMMSGQNPGGYSNYSPVTPPSPQSMNRTYMLPGGKIMNCSTTGNITNCF